MSRYCLQSFGRRAAQSFASVTLSARLTLRRAVSALRYFSNISSPGVGFGCWAERRVMDRRRAKRQRARRGRDIAAASVGWWDLGRAYHTEARRSPIRPTFLAPEGRQSIARGVNPWHRTATRG